MATVAKVERLVYNDSMKLPNQQDIKSCSPRERILFTAHQLFYQDGIRATGIDRLIAKSSVTKTTFYRQFPSKNQLIIEFLEFRHKRWMAWFIERLAHYGGQATAIRPTLSEWFNSDDYRGCAFINSLSELGTTLVDVVNITRNHKAQMAKAIEGILPVSESREMLIDGAIIAAQYQNTPEIVLDTLGQTINAIIRK